MIIAPINKSLPHSTIHSLLSLVKEKQKKSYQIKADNHRLIKGSKAKEA